MRFSYMYGSKAHVKELVHAKIRTLNGNFSCFYCHLVIFVSKLTFSKKNLSGTLSKFQKLGSRSGPTRCWSLSGSKTVCKGY